MQVITKVTLGKRKLKILITHFETNTKKIPFKEINLLCKSRNLIELALNSFLGDHQCSNLG